MADTNGGLQVKPMEQFIVEPLFGGDTVGLFTITNVTLWMALTVLAVSAILVLGSRGRALVPSRGQSVAELLYSFIYKMVEDVAGREAVRYFPYIMTLFMFVLFSNLLGLIPWSFATTSHFAVTLVLAMAVFLSVTVLGFVLNGPGFLKMFWVTSAPLAIRPVLAVIEVVSYFVRPLSHSIRLAGAMTAGHAVVKVFAAFAGVLGVFSFLPILAVTAMYGLELLVAVIQAYVFTILTCVYLRDAVHPHH